MSDTTAVGSLPDVPADAAPSAPARSPWVINAWVDYLFVCGGALWLVVAANEGVRQLHVPQVLAMFPLVLTIVGLIFADAHTASTLIRIYANGENRSRFMLYSLGLLVPATALLAVGFTVAGAAPVLLKLYLLWVVQHYSAQCYGFVLIYCFKRDYPLDPTTRKALSWLFGAITASGIIRQLAHKTWGNQQFLGVEVPFWDLLPKWMSHLADAAVAVLALAMVVLIAQTWMRTRRMFPLPAVVMTLSFFGFTFLTGRVHTLLWVYVPALFHGSQYVLLSASVFLKEQGAWQHKLLQWRSVAYLALAAAGGAAIYRLAPYLASIGGVEYTAGFVTIFAVVNFHHFLTDRAIWKLRDTRIRDTILA